MRFCRFLLVGLLFLPACRKTEPSIPTAGSSGEPTTSERREGAEAKSPLEKVVLAYLREHTNDPSALAILSWGPHDLQAECLESWRDPTKTETIIRVRYRQKNDQGALQLYDSLASVKDGKVWNLRPNGGGDEWVANGKAFWKAMRDSEQKPK